MDIAPAAAERPNPDLDVDRWWFEWATADGPSGWVDLSWYPSRELAVYACVVVLDDGRLVVTVDDEVPMATPKRSLEFRHAGLWAQHVCETPWEHWTVGLEAYGTAVTDPDDAAAAPAWGDPTPIGLDVEWEATAPPVAGAQPCKVSGEVLVGQAEYWVECTGWRGRGAPTRVDEPSATSGAVRAPAAGRHPTPWIIERQLVLDGPPYWIGG